jgi:hypothetical protein
MAILRDFGSAHSSRRERANGGAPSCGRHRAAQTRARPQEMKRER